MVDDTFEDEESEPITCSDCGMRSPATETNYTLIGARHGWRVTLAKDTGGPRSMEWRCPKCWERHKQSSGPGEGPRR